jgi:hypothetical protein
MKLQSFSFILGLLSSISVANATCLDDVSTFAIKICGEIDKSGTHTVVDASGKIDANISNIVKKIVGGGSADVSGKVLEETYTNVLQTELSKQIFNVLECRQKMVAVAVAQVCQQHSSSGATVKANCGVAIGGDVSGTVTNYGDCGDAKK